MFLESGRQGTSRHYSTEAVGLRSTTAGEKGHRSPVADDSSLATVVAGEKPPLMRIRIEDAEPGHRADE